LESIFTDPPKFIDRHSIESDTIDPGIWDEAIIMGLVYKTIADRLRGLSIDIEKYIYHEETESGQRISTLEEGPTTLEGIKFVAQNEVIGNGKPVVGIGDLKNALVRARKGGKRAFAGQVLEEDLNHAQLQASFLATEGLGFREIFYLSQRPKPRRDPGAGNVVNADGRAFDAKFGEMADAVDITSLHADLLGPINPTALPGTPVNAGHGSTNHMRTKSSIHLDEKGFVFADSDGRIFLSSNAFQHTGDELGIKDKLLDGRSPVSFFFHTDLNSISDPAIGTLDMRGNGTPRGVLGLELSKKSSGTQLYLRGSLGINADGLQRPKFSDFSGVVGLRKRF
jgi:hypothetical protein